MQGADGRALADITITVFLDIILHGQCVVLINITIIEVGIFTLELELDSPDTLHNISKKSKKQHWNFNTCLCFF